jgi:uncharacterized protein YjbI with pentapeptide repeats
MEWPTCTSVQKCRGVQLVPDGACIAHSDRRTQDLALAIAKAGANLDAFRGVEVYPHLLRRLLAACRPAPDERPILRGARFDRAILIAADLRGVSFVGFCDFTATTFAGDTSFINAAFSSVASFNAARFMADALFYDATFEDDILFSSAEFRGRAAFAGSAFRDGALFDKATFHGFAGFRKVKFADGADFDKVKFAGSADFDKVKFADSARFEEAIFRGSASFNGAAFAGGAWFSDCRFEESTSFFRTAFRGSTAFDGVRFGQDATFSEASFKREVDLGSARFGGDLDFESAEIDSGGLVAVAPESDLNLRHARFGGPLEVVAIAKDVWLEATTFASGGHLALVGAVSASSARFGGAITLTQPTFAIAVWRLVSWLARAGQPPSRTYLDSLAYASLEEPLTVGIGVSLEDCDFTSVQHLHRLEVLDLTAFARGPRSRRVIEGEIRWRAYHRNRAGSLRRALMPTWPEPWYRANAPSAGELAATYRALRRSREESLDAPGGGDFYYGELEMRRHDESRPSGERWVLWAYWAASGYGLRPLRSTGALALTFVLATALTTAFGLEASAADTAALAVFASVAGSAVSLTGQVTEELNTTGELIRLATRLLGPLFIGLTVLAIRGRVTR